MKNTYLLSKVIRQPTQDDIARFQSTVQKPYSQGVSMSIDMLKGKLEILVFVPKYVYVW
jgi:hypothetical protein